MMWKTLLKIVVFFEFLKYFMNSLFLNEYLPYYYFFYFQSFPTTSLNFDFNDMSSLSTRKRPIRIKLPEVKDPRVPAPFGFHL